MELPGGEQHPRGERQQSGRTAQQPLPSGCAFCAIAQGATAAAVVAEWPDVIAFLDRRPLFAGHTLVIPRLHVEQLAQLPPALAAPLWTAVQEVAAALPPALGAHGSFVAANNVVSQSVPHLHVHVVPRRRGDGLRGFFWPRQHYGGADEIESARSAIAAAIAPQRPQEPN